MVKINSFYIKLYPERIQILGIPFFNGKVDELFSSLREEGGLLTVPAAPALINIPKDKAYYDSLLNSDFIIADSGYMVLIWNLTFSPKISRISGLEFMNYFLDNIIQTKSKLFTINPSTTDARINTNYFLFIIIFSLP